MRERAARIPPDNAMEDARPKRGVAIKLFGVALIFLGVLDSMLSWRGGFEVHETYALMMAAGAFLYAIGAIRGGSGTPSRHDADHGMTRGRARQRVQPSPKGG